MTEVKPSYIDCRCGSRAAPRSWYCLAEDCPSAPKVFHCDTRCLNCEGCIKCECLVCREYKYNKSDEKLR